MTALQVGMNVLAGVVACCGMIVMEEPADRARPAVHLCSQDDTARQLMPEQLGPVLAAERPFDEALLSWNVDVPDGGAFVVDVRVGRRDGAWSPWLRIGSWGTSATRAAPLVRCEDGRIDVDVFRSERRHDRLQWRFRADGEPARAVLRRVTVCTTDTSALDALVPTAEAMHVAVPRLAVPFLSQQDADPALRRRVCSPTSVAMVLAARGRPRPVEEVAALLFDPDHDLYGNWTRAVQGAYTLGVPGYLRRFQSFEQVAEVLERGVPLIASIGVGDRESLTGAPYDRTAGHLLVVCGFTAAGDLEVNDPAAPAASTGKTVYRRDEMHSVWLRRGGVAYVLGE